MFTKLYQTVSSLWTEDSSDNADVGLDPNESYGSPNESTSSQYNGWYGCTANSYNSQESEKPNLSKPLDYSKVFNGKITHLFGDYGLIENDIYFTYSSIAERTRPTVGASVEFVLDVKGNGETKSASTVKILNLWYGEDGQEKTEYAEDVIGKITKYDKSGLGTINDALEFTSDAVPYDFKPYQGDWVICRTETNTSTNTTVVKSIQPLRKKNFSGEVTMVIPGYGYIDKKIHFPFLACENGYHPKKGDIVCGTAIESDQRSGRWRAIHLKPKGSTKSLAEVKGQMIQTKHKEDLVKNKCGVIISHVPEDLRLSSNERRLMNLHISNNSSSGQSLQCVSSSCSAGDINIQIQGTTGESQRLPAKILPGDKVLAKIELISKYLGRSLAQIIFEFQDFKILREISMTVEDKQMTLIAPSEGYSQGASPRGKSKMKVKWQEEIQRSIRGENISVPGIRPSRQSDPNPPVKLASYPVPRELQKCIMNDQDVCDIRPELLEPLMMENYPLRFSALLHLEEIQMEIDIRQFDLEEVSMKPWREFLSLEVTGLAEGRPSVMVGDKIILSKPYESSRSATYEGFIHEVHGEEVLIKFNPAFHETYQAEPYNVRFTFSRTSVRRCHQAAEFAVNLGKCVLFPSSPVPKPSQVEVVMNTKTVVSDWRCLQSHNIPRINVTPPAVTRKSYYQTTYRTSEDDRFLMPKVSVCDLHELQFSGSGKKFIKFYNTVLNARQKAAVIRILQGEGRPTPYILFGPPGTGKTVTVVEAILQVHHNLESSRILACTPSNSAADLLVERLHLSGRVEECDLVRLNAFRRSEHGIPEIIQPYCSDGENLEIVARHRIIVATCVTAGSFLQLGLKAGHFTHVFVDEAGQATEPECLIPLALSVGQDGQIILAGDPCQLGPVLSSSLAKKYGLEQSFLERLMKRPAYQRDAYKFKDHGCYDPLLVTKLVDNYRSHPALLRLSSGLFYDGELLPRADRVMREKLCSWDRLPTKNFPMVFHGLKGVDLREGNSPSWFNPMEAIQSVKYLQALLANKALGLNACDIGIITPYRKQVEKIKLLLKCLSISGIKVGSVEEFQGQERLVIIISTVRANESLIGFDLQHQIGFLQNPKRFNVAITRPQALLIIVGNPFVLQSDLKWKSLLRYAIFNNAYTGCTPPDMPLDEEEEAPGILLGNEEDASCIPEDSSQPPDSADRSGVEMQPSESFLNDSISLNNGLLSETKTGSEDFMAGILLHSDGGTCLPLPENLLTEIVNQEEYSSPYCEPCQIQQIDVKNNSIGSPKSSTWTESSPSDFQRNDHVSCLESQSYSEVNFSGSLAPDPQPVQVCIQDSVLSNENDTQGNAPFDDTVDSQYRSLTCSVRRSSQDSPPSVTMNSDVNRTDNSQELSILNHHSSIFISHQQHELNYLDRNSSGARLTPARILGIGRGRLSNNIERSKNEQSPNFRVNPDIDLSERCINTEKFSMQTDCQTTEGSFLNGGPVRTENNHSSSGESYYFPVQREHHLDQESHEQYQNSFGESGEGATHLISQTLNDSQIVTKSSTLHPSASSCREIESTLPCSEEINHSSSDQFNSSFRTVPVQGKGFGRGSGRVTPTKRILPKAKLACSFGQSFGRGMPRCDRSQESLMSQTQKECFESFMKGRGRGMLLDKKD